LILKRFFAVLFELMINLILNFNLIGRVTTTIIIFIVELVVMVVVTIISMIELKKKLFVIATKLQLKVLETYREELTSYSKNQ
jgi:hypothetical protein